MQNICFNDADDADLRSELDLKLSSLILQSRDPEGIVEGESGLCVQVQLIKI